MLICSHGGIHFERLWQIHSMKPVKFMKNFKKLLNFKKPPCILEIVHSMFSYYCKLENFHEGFIFTNLHVQSFVKSKPSWNGEITLSFTDMGKSCPSGEFLRLQICLLTNVFHENKILTKIDSITFANIYNWHAFSWLHQTNLTFYFFEKRPKAPFYFVCLYPIKQASGFISPTQLVHIIDKMIFLVVYAACRHSNIQVSPSLILISAGTLKVEYSHQRKRVQMLLELGVVETSAQITWKQVRILERGRRARNGTSLHSQRGVIRSPKEVKIEVTKVTVNTWYHRCHSHDLSMKIITQVCHEGE